MRIATWNINSIRSRLDRVINWLERTDTDVLAVGIVRDAEVVARLLTGLDDNGVDDLEAQGLVIRP